MPVRTRVLLMREAGSKRKPGWPHSLTGAPCNPAARPRALASMQRARCAGRTAMIRPALLALALAACACPAPAPAHGPAQRPLVELAVVDRDTGRLLPEYRHRGDDWIAGTPGHAYSVRLANTTGERVRVARPVAGANRVTGPTAAPSQAGYVLGAWDPAEIAGWRKSLDDVARFVFTDLPDSYAARTGRPGDVGVVGIAVFRERRLRPAYAPPSPPIAGTRDQAAKAAAPAGAGRAMAESQAMPQQLGTGHGQREWAPVGQTAFVRASSRPQQVSQLRYDDAGTLAALGIMPRPDRPRAGSSPRAF